jgi:hypothetical protein
MRCAARGEQVVLIQLAAPEGLVDPENVIWEVRKQESFSFPASDDLAEELRFVPGQTPSGFDQTVDLNAAIEAKGFFRVRVDTSLGSTALGFHLEDLEEGRILQANESGPDDQVSPESFRENPKGCEESNGILSGLVTLVAICLGLVILAAGAIILGFVRSGGSSDSGRG